MMYGTNVGDDMLARSRPSLWGNPMWDAVDVAAGGVMPGEGQLLYGLVRALNPETVIEVGTGHGFATLHLAAGIGDNGSGHLYTIEKDAGRCESASNNLKEAGLLEWVTLFLDEDEAIPGLPMADLVFLDAGHETTDIQEYIKVINLAPDGIIVIHDARHMNHVEDYVTRFSAPGWQVVFLPTVSLMGMAILSRGES